MDIKKITGKPKQEIENRRRAKSPPTQPFPVDALPFPLARLILEMEECNGFNPEFQAGAALAIFSAAAGNRFSVQVKTGWREPCILWVPIVGDPSTLKTPALKTYMKPLWTLEQEWQELHKQEIGQWRIDVEEKRVSADEPPPSAREIVVSSTTMEAIFKTHAANRNGLIMYRDELAGWAKSMDQYRNKGGDDQEIWLSIYNNDTIKISRATKETAIIPNACVSVLGGIQPAVLKDLANGEKDENGFTYRLSFIFPTATETPGWIEKEADMSFYISYQQAVRKVAEYREPSAALRFTAEAKKLFVDWYNSNAQMVKALEGDHHRKAIYKKLEAILVRCACVVQVMKWGYGLDSNKYIAPESVQSAIKMAEYFRETSLRAHGAMKTGDTRVERASELYQDGKTLREIADIMKVSKSQVGRWKKSNESLFVAPVG